jgi:PAS domain S-box-containing protein
MKLSTRLMLAMVALALLSTAIVGGLSTYVVESIALRRVLGTLEFRTRLPALELEASTRSARGDALGFASAVAVDGIVRASLAGGTDTSNGITLAQWRDRLAARFVAELSAKPNYVLFRVIGVADGGREIVRVDRDGPGSVIRVVPPGELQQQARRDYFQRAVRLAQGEVDVSPVELNRGRAGVIDDPPLPVLRVSTPIHAPDGTVFAFVIINVDMREQFSRLRTTDAAEQVFLVNERGDYLVHPDRGREFGFEFGRPQRIQDDFPGLADALAKNTATGLLARDRHGTEFGIGLSAVKLAQGTSVTTVLVWPYSRVIEAATAVRDVTLVACVVTILIAIGIAYLLARSLTRPLRQMTAAVEAFGRGAPMQAPVDAHGEIGTLARAFTQMASEVKEKSAALSQETAERKRLFETSLDLILMADSQGHLTQINPSSFAILGYRPDEMIGKSGREFIYPDDLEIAREEMRRSRRERITRIFECRYRHKDGHPVALQWTGVWSEPERRHFFIGRDVTERKKAEDALLESERVARGIIDVALDAFIQMDEAGNIIEWNPQAEVMFGWRREEVIGCSLGSIVVPPVHRERHTEGLARFRRTGEEKILGKRFEIEAQKRDGHIFRVEIAVTALRRTTGYVFNGFLRDLTDKIAAEAQLRQAQKMDAVGQLTGGVAHDFNNILTVITGTIEILRDGVADRPQLAEVARMIDEAAARGADLTQQLLAFARRQPLQPRRIDPNALMLETAALLRPTLGEHIEIATALESEAWQTVADPALLTTAVLNLAVNARDAMPNGGKLTLETCNVILDEAYAQANPEVRPGPFVMIAVSDTGTGIPQAMIDRVFEPFFTTKDVGKGTGLGLSMVYGFVKQSGGNIKVYSEEGHGTTVKIYLPRAEGEAEPVVAHGAMQIVGGNETILVVEDDNLVREYLVAQLQGLGYATLSATQAAEALALVEAGAAFDLLLTDVIMPGGMNGRQLADEIERRRPGTKVLFTSGYTENAIVHHGRLDPGVALLNKPYRKKDLAEKVRQVLDAPPRATP